MSAKEKSTPSNPQPNNNTYQHCRPKPSPSSTAVPIRLSPARGDVRHKELKDVQGGGQVHVEGGQVPCLPPAEGDVYHIHAKEGMPARVPGKGGGLVQADEVTAKGRTPRRKLLANNKTCQHCRSKPSPSSTAVPIHHDPAQGDVRHQELKGVQGGGRVHVEGGQVPCLPPAQGDDHHVRQAQAKEGSDVKVPCKGGVRVQADVEQELRHPPAQGDAHHRTKFSKTFLVIKMSVFRATTRTTSGAHQ